MNIVSSRKGIGSMAIVGIIAVILVIGGIALLAQRGGAPTDGEAMAKSVEVELKAESNSGQSGTATLSEVKGTNQTKVVVNLSSHTSGVPEPAHIHAGACPTPGEVVYGLTPLEDGASETMLNVSFSEILAELPLALNVHESAENLGEYVACGDIHDDAMIIEEDAMMEKEGGAMIEDENDGVMMEDGKVVVMLTGRNFLFSRKEIRVKKGDTVRIEFEGTGGFHDWAVDEFDAATEQVNPGTKTSVEFVADKAGTFEYYCSVGSHREMGMVGKLIVE